jgi:hypothetical protein
MNGNNVVMAVIPGYDPSPNTRIPFTDNTGGSSVTDTKVDYKIPPVVWMFVFLVVGYVGLRLMMED